MTESDLNPLVIFDGECAMCNRAVNFIVSNESGTILRFASKQGSAGGHMLAEHGLTKESAQSIVLIENGAAYLRSDASLRLSKYLRMPWSGFHTFLYVPRPIRDFCYSLVAKNRHKFTGRIESCANLSPEVRERII